MSTFTLTTVDAMIQLGYDLAATHSKFLLYGDLGAGKTHFTKWVAQQLGISPTLVQSPTYVYFHSYESRLLHIDMYRIGSVDDLTLKGILDEIDTHEHIVIERPRYVDSYSDTSRCTVHITIVDTDTRIVEVR